MLKFSKIKIVIKNQVFHFFFKKLKNIVILLYNLIKQKNYCNYEKQITIYFILFPIKQHIILNKTINLLIIFLLLKFIISIILKMYIYR